MNVLAAATTLKVHYTTSEIISSYQVVASPICRRSEIAGYVSTEAAALQPVNCPKCIAKAAAAN